MSKKSLNSFGGLVYSTNPDEKLEDNFEGEETTSEPRQQKLRIRMETKHRAGKVVTIVAGFIGSGKDCEELGKKIKSFCGTGGSVKDFEIIIQGDHKVSVLQWLLKNGYTGTK